MSKEWHYRFAPLAALLFVAFATVGCESKGPAERAGVNIDKGVQTPKTHSILRAPLRRLGGPSTAPSNPEPDELLSVYNCQFAFEKQRPTARREKTKASARVAPITNSEIGKSSLRHVHKEGSLAGVVRPLMIELQ